ncbi:Ribonuclease H domain - like 7 [Theobroma cacao]|nr:Ribonuclease H domain - like 7 [Theobroma cacao]
MCLTYPITSTVKGKRSKLKVSSTWTPPPYSTLKLNIDGAAKGKPGPAGIGGVLRDHQDHSKVPWRMKLISNAIETLCKSIRKVTFNHISRELNLIADGLAKAGVLRAVNFSTFLQPPRIDPSSEA